jgi:glycerol-3-phosphate O-acyltransferase
VDDACIVFLLDARDSLESDLLRDWVGHHEPTSSSPPTYAVVTLGNEAPNGSLGEFLESDDPVWMQPLRIAWLPASGNAANRSLANFFFGRMVRPGRMRRRWLARHRPERLAFVAGDGAYLHDLRERHTLNGGAADTRGGLPDFVVSQALITLDRSERTIRGARYKVPRTLHSDVFADEGFRQTIVSVAQQRDLPVSQARKIAAAHLKEMAAAQDPFTLELTIALYRAACRSHHDAEIGIIDAQLEQVADTLASRPVVFLISHKSMLDTMALSLVLFDENLPPPLTFGGINLRTPGIGALARRSGIIFLRRTFQNNEIYKATFRRYIDYLIEKRFSLLWALEGTRSRTGKLLPPRFGLFNYVVDSILRTKLYDVTFIPVTVAYDQITEVDDYSTEQRGRSKKPEGTAWILRFLRRGRSRGQIHLRFGKSLTITDIIDKPELELGIDDQEKQALVATLAFEVAVRMNAATPITATAIITLILLASGNRALSLNQIQALARSGAAMIRHRKLEIVGRSNFRDADAVRATLAELHETGILNYLDEGTERLYAIGEDQHLNAAYYRNTAIHYFILDAIVEIALLDGAPDSIDPYEAFFSRAAELREVFKFEFYFPRRAEYRHEIEKRVSDRFTGWEDAIRQGEIHAAALLQSVQPLVAHGVLRSFVDAYRIVAKVLATMGSDALEDEAAFLARCLKTGKQQLLQGRVFSAESISKSLYETGLKLAEYRGLLAGGRAEARHELHQQFRHINSRLDQILAITLQTADDQ